MNQNVKKSKAESIKNILLTIVGITLTSAAISLFLTPNKIVSGGMSGVSTILFHTLGLPPGITFGVLNVVLLAIGLKVLGWSFTLKTLFGAGLLSVFVQLFSYLPPVTTDKMLATVFGGVMYGAGIGMALVSGASTGGTDILGRLVQHIFPQMPIGKLLLVIDGLVILVSLVVFKDVNLVLMGVVSLFVSTYAIDWLVARLNLSTIAFIISDKGDELAHFLVGTSHRGVTIIDAVGAYTNENKKMLFCALKEHETVDFKKKIEDIDPQAFTVFSESQKIVGNGFYLYR